MTKPSVKTGKSNGNSKGMSAKALRKKRRLTGALAGLLTVVMIAEIVLRLLSADLQALPYIPIILLFVPWFILVGALASGSAVAHSIADTDDQYARVMTLNVYKGEADAQTIVDLVREERVEVLALQETTNDFVEQLKNAHIETYLPYSQVSTMDGAYGNGLWSATPLAEPVDDAVNSSASFMPGGTVQFSGGQKAVRFVSVHTTSPRQGDWRQWKRSLDELGLKRGDEGTRYVFMGDFNATMDHASMREFLGARFRDAAYGSGHGFAFTSPTNLFAVPAVAAVDHVVVDSDMTAGQVQVKRITGSDHAALLATIDVGR